MPRIARELRVRGVVQGVGFRPFVYRLATELELGGAVRNLGDAGVEIVVEGSRDAVERFLARLQDDAPPLARVESVDVSERALEGLDRFAIRPSTEVGGSAGALPPDIAVCDDCLDDLTRHPRYAGYWATTCTNCGPRFTVIDGIPYDRPRTSMDDFPMCPDCLREYTDPGDRRYHAQTIACPACGPTVRLDGDPERAVDRAREALAAGRIVAIKGIGGTHLACDATNDDAVRALRERLGRRAQPFALMATATTVETVARVDDDERRLLHGAERPIVVLRRRAGALPESVAPGLHTIGVMLPYSGLHHLLLQGLDRPLVMTSANAPGRPMLIENDRIERDLARIADHFLLHDRRIVARCDDSVVRRSGGDLRFLRRSRGFVPDPIPLPLGGDPVLAVGGETDVAFALYDGGRIVLSQHIGAVDNPETLGFLREAIDHLMRICGVAAPAIVACDLHPGFETTRLAGELAETFGWRCHAVQHHEAHVASVLAEHRVRDAVGIVLDGFGHGRDATAWGGELFLVEDGAVRRAGSLVPVPLPGGDLATRRPLRVVAGILHEAGIDPARIARLLAERGMDATDVDVLLQQLARGVNAPSTTSAGRFLDAVAALLGVCDERTYEGEPAMRLEATAAKGEPLPVAIEIRRDGDLLRLDGLSAFVSLCERVDDCRAEDLAASAQRFLADGFAQMAIELARERGLAAVAFSGGVAYNDAISRRLRTLVEAAGLDWLTNRCIPCGDGGVAFGQVVLAVGDGEIPRYGQ
ncbi:MAG: carbamoyltransferase HypF [Candidatus Bipolaricaulota bacterium]|nr:MAG: carbamoyltransferase HypF [Candidatus Bipolaricaulota bacterium]